MKPNNNEKIAVVSMSCRFPGANNPEEFWNTIIKGKNVVAKIPAERWNKDEFYSASNEAKGKTNQKHGAFLKDIHKMDPFFFNISPKEAIEMSPSQKLMLELAWELVENSSIAYGDVYGSNTGVFIGNIWADFENLRKQRNAEINSFSATGLSPNIIANRVSYFMGLTGPSFVVDTGCSSSMVALMLAVQALRDGSADTCITGGINHILNSDHYIYLAKFGGLSSKGQCSSFSADADGFVRAEGAGLIMLKRLSDALRDGDKIHAVILGGAINNNGVNDTMPATSTPGQIDLLERAYKNADVDPKHVQYIETHGTGTRVGDPVEAKALGQFFSNKRINGDKLYIGSVKTNYGHTEGAAGIAGVLKAIMAIEKGILPKNLNFNAPNPLIDFEKLKIEIPTKNMEWKVREKMNRVAGVSSFGWGGTNVHIVIEEFKPIKNEEIEKTIDSKDRFILPLSARSEEALKDYAIRYYDLLKNTKDTKEELAQICAGTALLKPAFEYRKAFVSENKKDLLYQLMEYKENSAEDISQVEHQSDAKIVFVFPGQGSQWFGMGKELYAKEPVFKNTIIDCDGAFSRYVDWSLRDEIFADKKSSKLDRIDVIQPYLFAMQVALARLWESWGITPDSVVGHSMGEVAAAYISGSLSLDDAANVICTRSLLMNTLRGKGGAMAVTGLSGTEAEKVIKKFNGKLSVAVENSPDSTVVAGSQDAIDEVIKELEEKEIFVRQVKVDVASHSPQMDEIKDQLVSKVANVKPQDAKLSIYSSVKGVLLKGKELDAAYWGDNLRGTVKFSTIMSKLVEDEHTLFIEVSPHPVLKTAMFECVKSIGKEGVNIATSLQREKPEQFEMKMNLAHLFELGYSIDKGDFFKLDKENFVKLPHYPFQRENYEIKDLSALTSAEGTLNDNQHPLLGKKLQLADSENHYWESNVSTWNLPLLKEHKVNENPIFPASFYMEMLFAATKQVCLDQKYSIESMQFIDSIAVQDEKNTQIQLKISTNGKVLESFSFYRFNETENSWVATCIGKLERKNNYVQPQRKYKFSYAAETIEESLVYNAFMNMGVEFGPNFRIIKQVQVDHDNDAIAYMQLNDEVMFSTEKFVMHPVILDACIHPIFSKVFAGIDNETIKSAFVVGLERVMLFNEKPSGNKYSIGLILQDITEVKNNTTVKADLCLYDENFEPVLEMQGVEARISDTKIKKEVVDDKFNFSLLESVHTETDNEKRLEIIEEHLIKLVSKIIKAPANKIKSSMTFKNLGIDSIAMVMLQSLVESDFEFKFTVQKFKDHPSIKEFGTFLNASVGISEAAPATEKIAKKLSAADRWFTKPKPNPEAKHQLFLIHDAGGNKNVFDSWHDRIKPDIEIIIVQLPGRNDRSEEPAFRSVNALLEELVPLMNDEIKKPFSIYGHSMGGLLAFEIARELQHSYGKFAQKLIVSGTPGLRNYDNKFVNYIVDNDLSERDVHTLMPKFQRYDFEDPTVRKMIQVLMNDMKLIHSYKYTSKPLLESDIIAFHAINDVRVRLNDVEKWESETRNEFKLIEVPGSHNFVYYESDALTRLINIELDDMSRMHLLTEIKYN
jgi:acyl transferase domain-containing protein/surfactin synthase thioesterase subunit